MFWKLIINTGKWGKKDFRNKVTLTCDAWAVRYLFNRAPINNHTRFIEGD